MLVSELEFGSFLAYCSDKSTQSEKIKESKNVMLNLKKEQSTGNPPRIMSQVIAERIKQNLTQLPFKDFFGKNVALVPVPRSSLMKTDSLWVSDKIAKALANQGFGAYFPCLERIKAVTKSAYAKPDERPKAQDHFNSIKIKSLVYQPIEILLIDDPCIGKITLIDQDTYRSP